MKKSTILKQAKRYLGTARTDGVCAALDDWLRAEHDPNDVRFMERWDTVNALQNEIQDMIDPFVYAHRWLSYVVNFGRVPDEKNWFPNDKQNATMHKWSWYQNPANIQAWRLRWMDELIAYYKSRGD